MRRVALFCVLLLPPTSVAWAQSSASTSPNDSLYRRARRWVSEGNGPAGRALVDSLLKGEPEGSKGYGDALYWRGALAETAADAERDYRRVIVEYPLSVYADDALLAIAELEQARGDREGALQHLQRFVKEHPVSAARGTAAFAAARLAFEQRDTRTGCAMLAEAHASVPATNVELRNQIDYFDSRCPAGVATVNATAAIPAPAPSPATARPPAAARKVTEGRSRTVSPGTTVTQQPPVREPRHAVVETPSAQEVVLPAPPVTPSSGREPRHAVAETPPSRDVVQPTPPATPSPSVQRGTAVGPYTIQLAAYTTRADAERLVKKLGATGVKARVSGTAKPFRVRLDFFPTRQAAQDQVVALKQRGIIGFVTTEGPSPQGSTP